ncbi:sensor histidine kinase [Cellulosilyticum sp. I15G10I2]|uniref:sensor histidine kinase n=1 Tax=Cellulosilyticum sp. I15G10I2 TaxID=1892843 RepID=UPI00085BD5DE|nr:sensor histidine kinase [Cellulosilyticum sp. I15G10I2]
MRIIKKLKAKLIVYFFVVVILILIIVEGISFWWIKSVIQSQVSEATLHTLKQIDKNFLGLVGDINDMSKYTLANREVRYLLKLNPSQDYEATEALIQMNEQFANLTNSKSYIASINIYGDNGRIFETAGSSINLETHKMNITKNDLPKNGNYIISPTYKRFYQTLGNQYIISFFRRINDINQLSKSLGMIRIDVSEKNMNAIYKDIELGKTGFIFITDKEGRILSHSQKDQLGQNISEKDYYQPILESKGGYYRKNVDGRNMLITYHVSQHFIFIGQVPFDELIGKVNTARNLTIIVTLAGILTAFLTFYVISSKISNPISTLKELMKQVEEGNLNVDTKFFRDDEIGQLYQSFHHMVRRIKALVEEVYDTKLKKKEAELQALQMQINPHFLYNTLDVAYWTSRMEKASKTGEIISALSNVFRLGLNKGNEMTTIRKEIEHLKSYLEIQALRYEVVPDFKIDVSPDILEYKIIKLILQPLVENALIHGIAHLDEYGYVQILGYEKGEDIILEVIDNGIGMTREKIDAIFKGEQDSEMGYGIKNVHERIQLYFGNVYGLVISSEVNVGTKVKISVPKAYSKGEGSSD